MKYGASMEGNKKRRFVPRGLSQEQQRALSSRGTENLDDAESSGFLDVAMLDEDDEEEEEKPDSDDEAKKKRKPKPSLSNFRRLSPPEIKLVIKPKVVEKAPEKPKTPPPPTPVRAPTPTPPPPVAVAPEPEPVKPPEYPALPRFISQFRGESWFDHYFPRALPETFNFLRPTPVNGEIQQIRVSDFLDFLISNEEAAVHRLSLIMERPGTRQFMTETHLPSAEKMDPRRRISVEGVGKKGLIYNCSVDIATSLARGLQKMASEGFLEDEHKAKVASAILELLREQVACLFIKLFCLTSFSVF